MSDKLARHLRNSVQQVYAELDPGEVLELLDRLCIEQGFCLKPKDKDRLSESPPTDVIAFTRAVFAAEGIDPDLASRDVLLGVGELVHAAFVRHSKHA